jgi:hypothetical protein
VVCVDTEKERPQVERERSAAAAMLGMPGFVVLAVSDHDGELEQAIESTADLVGAPSVGRWPRVMIGARCGCGTCRRAVGR